jgi:hypothetical protein
MGADPRGGIGVGITALLFAVTFLSGGLLHPLNSIVRDRRVVVSFGSGMAIAYVFMGTMPDLHHARTTLMATAPMPLPYQGMAIYYLALAGFLAFYGLDHLRVQVQTSKNNDSGLAFKLHIGGFAAYVWLMVFTLGEEFNPPVEFALYALAIAFHFLAMDHALREAHPSSYDRVGRYILAVMCLVGWAMSQVLTLPNFVLALLVAFISGAIVVNSSIGELPREKDGRFIPFLAGGGLYGLLLWYAG